ncbi:LCP family protein [Cohnella massiliensis]|uniref:LCP family protein n=1 Tax=Cohnella massiliensis TaxID=1816691 RepID=UPI0009BBCF86|nr:LCP family protein [Cohnella massiliensis]
MKLNFPKTKLRRTMLGVGVFLCIVVIGVAAYAGYLVYKTDSALNQIAAPNDPSPSASAPAASEEPEPEAEESPRAITFLLAGVDSRSGSGGTLNTDVLMLASLNPQTHTAKIVSLPRDMHLKPKTLEDHKANYYYAYFYNKDKETAIANTKNFYSELFQLPIDYMAVINFEGLSQLVDALGGLTIDVDMDMKYRDNADGTNIDLKKGVQELSGKEVLDFVRYRKSNGGTGQSSDIERNGRQQQVISQIVGKLASFKGVTQWDDVIDIVGDNVRSDIPKSELRDWILNFGSMKPDVIQSIPLETRWESPYILVDEDDLNEAITSLRSEAGLPPANDLKLADVVSVDPSSDSVQ